jgi:hypothetical protein
LLRLAGNCAPHALGVIAVLHVVRKTARFVSAREDRNEEKTIHRFGSDVVAIAGSLTI